MAECAGWRAGGLRPPLRRITEYFEKRREGHTPGWLLLPLRGNSPSAPPLQHFSTTRNGLVVFVGEPLGLPPHPSGLTASHLPLKGKALKTRSSAFPFRGRCPRRGRMRYPCFELGMLARQTQAREWNRASSNFRKPRARWAGGNLDQPLGFCAPEILQNLTGMRPPL